jgi:hypothetical protein
LDCGSTDGLVDVLLPPESLADDQGQSGPMIFDSLKVCKNKDFDHHQDRSPRRLKSPII